MSAYLDPPDFEFYGRHLLLNLSHCKVDLDDLPLIKKDLIEAVEMVGATILGSMEHKFSPKGCSVLLLLSESHASVHTYPEYKSCFLDLFTCGRSLDVQPFADILIQRWQPASVHRTLQERLLFAENL